MWGGVSEAKKSSGFNPALFASRLIASKSLPFTLPPLATMPGHGGKQHGTIGHVPLAELNQFPAKVSGNVDVPFLVRLGSPVLEFGFTLDANNPTSVIVHPHIQLVQVSQFLLTHAGHEQGLPAHAVVIACRVEYLLEFIVGVDADVLTRPTGSLRAIALLKNIDARRPEHFLDVR